uniref:XRN2-binding (XTBD) domain-containing protein n=1 Tax=Sphenodon punctatus TaxID=8508 RepID=A0A8D0HPF7_SPHPU
MSVRGLISSPVLTPDLPERFHSYSENEKYWQVRCAFILHNLLMTDDEPACRINQLLMLSMVSASHPFMGCSCNKDLLEKVIEMTEGIEVEDMPQFTTQD